VIRAPASGTVRFAGILAGRPVLSLDHGNDVISSFEPVITRLRQGQPVRRDDVLGWVGGGPTHCAPAICLHWGVRKNGRYIDPLLLLPVRPGPAVLLPMPH
jgi:murein DD-endopeptidase MepM/ murein hydrolase activator NlpD